MPISQPVINRIVSGTRHIGIDEVLALAYALDVSPARLFLPVAEPRKAAGVPRIRLHDLRHTHTTLLIGQGVHPRVVSDRLGHGSAAFTLDVYSHAAASLDEQAAESVAALISRDR
jgi:integrase